MTNLPNFTKPQAGDKPEGQPPVDDTKQPLPSPEPPGALDAPIPDSDLSTVEWLRKELEKTRKEAADRRIKEKEALRKLEAFERQKLEEQGQYQRLYEQAKADLEAKQLEIENGTVYRSAFEEMLRKRVEAIPEAMRGLVPSDYEPLRLAQWLDANWERLGARRAPNLDAGAGGPSGGKPPQIDPIAADLAKKLGIAPEKLAG